MIQKKEKICFWSGQPTGTVFVDASVAADCPEKIILDYEPHDSIRAQWEKGIVVIEVSEDFSLFENQSPIQGNLYPTQRFIVLRREAIAKMFDAGEKVDGILRDGRMYLDSPMFEKLLEQISGKWELN